MNRSDRIAFPLTFIHHSAFIIHYSDGDDHLSPLGEFQGVAHQIDEQLAKPNGVAGQRVGNLGANVAGQSQRFGPARGDSGFRASVTVRRREKSTRSSSILPDSILEKSRISLITISRASAEVLTVSK